jgi:cytochrome c-type biogenesis protein CcmF
MIAELGLFALILALLVAAIQSVVPLVGAERGFVAWMGIARPAAIAQFALVGLAFGALTWAHITDDFSVLNVAQNSHTDKPMLYKVTGVWGNHEGSMMLWTFIIALYGMAVAVLGGALPPGLRARALSVQAMIAVGFILFILLTSNPFVRLDPAPANGNGLNPLLQDPGLAFHPPLLYLGYVGFSMAFSFAIAALIEGRVDAAWARWVRPWTLLAWCCLTLGIAMGSWWAYYTLGWGGWWAWDPVENASFMPWLAGTALLHSLTVSEKRDALKSWTIFLAIVTFSLSLLGTFLVRSGVLTSVHSFATDPARGVFVLALLVLVTGGSLVLFTLRAPALKAGGLFAPISREGALLFNNIVLSTAAGTVLLGTLYPLFIDALQLGQVSVGPPYFNIVLAPLMVPMLLVMAVGPLLAWKRGDLRAALSRLGYAGLATLATIVLTWIAAGVSVRSLLASVGLGLAAWLLIGTATEWAGRIGLFKSSPVATLKRAARLPRSAYGMTLAHAGFAIALIGISGSLAWRTEKIEVMRPGETVKVAGYQLTLKGVEDNIKGPNYSASRATFIASKNGRFIAEMKPERRMYTVPPQPTTDIAIRTNLISDLYVVIGEPDGKGAHVARLYHIPLVPWIFFGALVMVAGGAMSLSDRRHRVGAPVRKQSLQAAAFAGGLQAPALPISAGAAALPGRMFLLPISVFLILVGFLVYRLALVGEGDTPNLIASVLIGKEVPAFELPPLLAEKPGLSAADLRGKVTLVNFFASWCEPCRAEHPILSQIAKDGIMLAGINYKDQPEDARAWLANLGDPYTVIAADRAGRTGIDFGVYGVPESYLIDKEGVIRFKQTGPLTAEIIREKLIPLVEKLSK